MSRFRDESHEDELEEQVRRFPERFTSDRGGFWDPEPPLFPELARTVAPSKTRATIEAALPPKGEQEGPAVEDSPSLRRFKNSFID